MNFEKNKEKLKMVDLSFQISKDTCKGCPAFEENEYKDNMIQNNICGKRECIGCSREKNEKKI